MLEQEKKFNPSQLIGFVLLGALFLGYLYFTNKKQKEKQEQFAKEQLLKPDSLKTAQTPATDTAVVTQTQIPTNDSIKTPSKGQLFKKENKQLRLEFNSKGAQLQKVELKNFKRYTEKSKSHKDSLFLVNQNTQFNIVFKTASGKEYNTRDLIFSETESQKDSLQMLTFTTAVEGGVLQFIYGISPNYQISFQVKTQGLQLADNPQVLYDHKAFELEKGRSQEQIYTDLHYAYNNLDKTSYEASELDEPEREINWFCIKQQFFLTILESESGFKNSKAQITQINPEKLEKLPYLKDFKIQTSLDKNAQLNEKFTWYFLPMDLNLLNTYKDKSFDDLVPFDYLHSGIIGWLNKHFFYQVFLFFHNLGWQSGWVIFLMTIIVKLLLSPVMYRQNRSSAMMRALKPDITELNEKYKDDPLKKQQATMSLYSKVGVSPFSGCIPALIQVPLFMALFRLFPNIIQMRGEGFLWADDLTAYDSIVSWNTWIPVISSFYGNHVSLFALLYAATLLIYTRMNSANMQQPTQEGMPDMKYIMYLMPLMFVFFLNSYASGLSWYYLVSNALNIVIILVIKQFFIDEDKLHALVQENKNKEPKKKKKGKFQQLLEQAAEQQKKQQAAAAKNKKKK